MAIDYAVAPTLYVWPTPDTTAALKDIKLLSLVRAKDWDTAAGNALPARWTDALLYGLASRLAPDYGVSVSEQQNLERRANDFLFKAKGGDSENATYQFVEGAFSNWRRF